MPLQFEDFSAWITMDGRSRDVYAVETPRSNAITCWIASESGKKFSVNWRNSTREYPLQGTVLIDGVVCDNHIMLDRYSFPDRPNAVGVYYARTSDCTRRDFMFTSIETTDDDAYLYTVGRTYNIGTITLELWRLHVIDVVSKPVEHQLGSQVLEGQLVHEQSKKAGAHHVKYGKEYYSPAPVVDVVTAHKLDPEPLVTFTFKYRPMALLMANGIVPRPARASEVERAIALEREAASEREAELERAMELRREAAAARQTENWEREEFLVNAIRGMEEQINALRSAVEQNRGSPSKTQLKRARKQNRKLELERVKNAQAKKSKVPAEFAGARPWTKRRMVKLEPDTDRIWNPNPGEVIDLTLD